MAEQELARVSASASRRVIGAGSMILLGAALLSVALSTPPQSLLWLAFLLVLALGALWMAQRLWAATGHDLVLTDAALVQEDGTVIATLDQIAKVDRGTFAMKASNGFNIHLKSAQPAMWRPGLWWRMGKRIGIGGVVSGHYTRPMADILTAKVAERQG